MEIAYYFILEFHRLCNISKRPNLKGISKVDNFYFNILLYNNFFDSFSDSSEICSSNKFNKVWYNDKVFIYFLINCCINTIQLGASLGKTYGTSVFHILIAAIILVSTISLQCYSYCFNSA